MCRRVNSKGLVCIAFGTGLIIACCVPNCVTIIILAALLVIFGIAVCRG